MMQPIAIPNRPFTWREAEQLGYTRKQLTALIDSRQVVRVLKGVYQPTDLSNTPSNRLRAASLATRPFVVISDRLAAWVYGVNTFAIQELEALPPIETCVPPDKTRVRHRCGRGRRRDLSPRDVELIDGLRVTSPLRTALDLACALRRRDALAVLDGFMRVCGVTRREFEAELPRYVGRRGVIQLRFLVPFADPRSESPGESWTRIGIIDEGLPLPELQYSIVVNGREIYRLDLAYVRQRIAVEYDGEEFHSSAVQREHDRRRREWLKENGWTIIVVRKNSFASDARTAWTGQLRQLLRAA